MPELIARVRGRRIDLDREQVVKLFPTNPPTRGEIVLVDDVRSRVTRAKVKWDGPHWTILELRVKNAPEADHA